MDQWIAALRKGEEMPVSEGLVASRRRIAPAEEWHESLPPGDARLCVVISGEWRVEAPNDQMSSNGATAYLIGPTDRTTRIETSGGDIIIVDFAAGGWARLIATPAYRAANRIFREGSAAAIPTVRTSAITIWPAAPRESLVGLVLTALGDDILPTVDQLARRAGVSSRTLHRCCADTFGFGPLTLLKRERLLRTLRNFRAVQPRRIADIIPVDYFDQSHFNREFKAFMGATPSEYRRGMLAAA